MNMIFIQVATNYEANGYGHGFGVANHLALSALFHDLHDAGANKKVHE